jgi:tetratricopeptide (TPR) repeat protein
MMIGDDTLSGGTQEFGTGTLDTTQVTDTRQPMHKEKRALLEVIEGPSKGRALAFDDRILVGRQTDCDLVIEDKTVSRQHLRIERTGKKLVATALNKNNPVLLGPKAISSAPLKDGDVLRIGESALRVSMGAATVKDADKGAGKPNKVRMAIYVLLLVLALGILIVAVLPSKMESPSQSVVDQERDKLVRIQDAALKREISVHLTNGKQFLERRDYVQAQSRFKRVLELAPDNAEAQSLLAEVEAHIQKDEERKLQAEQRAREIREKLSPLFTEANVLFATKDYAKAREILLQAQELAPDNPDVNKLLAEVEQALEEQRAQQEEQAAQQEKALTKVKHSYAKAMQFRDEKQLYRALREFLYLLSLDVESEETDAARRLVPELEQQLLEMTRKDFTLGEELLAKDNPTEALQAWRAVLDVYPDHKDAKARIERLMPAIAQKGKELYQEGLVYEDLGQAEMAVKKWLEAVDTLTIVTGDEYLGKAKKKLESYPSLVSSPRD